MYNPILILCAGLLCGFIFGYIARATRRGRRNWWRSYVLRKHHTHQYIK